MALSVPVLSLHIQQVIALRTDMICKLTERWLTCWQEPALVPLATISSARPLFLVALTEPWVCAGAACCNRQMPAMPSLSWIHQQVCRMSLPLLISHSPAYAHMQALNVGTPLRHNTCLLIICRPCSSTQVACMLNGMIVQLGVMHNPRTCACRFLTNLSFILFGLTGLLGAAVSVHHLLRGPCPLRQPQFLPSSAVRAAAPPARGAHNGAAAGSWGATGAVHPTVTGVARAAGDSGATWHAEAGAGFGKAGSGGFRDNQPARASDHGAGQPAGARRGASGPGAVHGADVRSADGADWPVYEVRPSCELLGQGTRQATRASSC